MGQLPLGSAGAGADGGAALDNALPGDSKQFRSTAALASIADLGQSALVLDGDRSLTTSGKLVPIGAAIVMLVSAAVLTIVSISGTSDTPCGSILSPEFSWYPRSQCGLVYRGTLAAVVILGLLGCGLLISSGRVVRSSLSARAASLVTVAVVSVGAGSVGVLAWCASIWPAPVLRRGWITVRNLAGLTTLGIAIVGFAVAAAADRTARQDR